MIFSAILFCSLIIISDSTICEANLCNFEDPVCVTKTFAELFVSFVSGELGAESSDPLHLDVIKDELSRDWYKLTNASFYGLKNCKVELMKYIPKYLQYKGHLNCPHLRLESECEIKNKPGLSVDEKGICTADLFNYHVYFTGDYEKKSNKKGQIYTYLGNTTLDFEKGKVEYNYETFSNVHNEKDDAKCKGDSEIARILLQDSTINAFFKKYLKNGNVYLQTVPAENMFLSL